MIFNSIRWRLQAWHSLLLVLVLVGFGVTAYRVARGNQLRRIDQELQQRLMSAFRPGPPPAPHLGEPGHPGEMHRDKPPSEHGGNDRGHEHDAAGWRAHMQEVIAHAGALEAGQSNAFYY